LTFTVNFNYSDHDNRPVQSWTVDWGDGMSPANYSGSTTSAGHHYLEASGQNPFSVVVSATNSGGTYAGAPLPVTVHAAPVLDPDGTLRVVGNAAADAAGFSDASGVFSVTFGVSAHRYNDSLISRVVYSDGGGNDSINVSAATPITINTTGNDSITINDTSGVTLNPGSGSLSLALNTGTTTIPAGTLSGIRQVNFSNLGIAAGAKLVVAQSSSTNNDYSHHANRSVLNIAAGGLSIATGGTLDMGDNDMILHYAPANQATANSQIRGLLASGFDGASWDTPGINSSTANYDANFGAGTRTLGYADNNDLGYTSFDGVDTSDGNEVLVKFTYYGDSDLNGQINGTDFSLFGAGKSGAGSGWDFGDYDYTGGRPNGTDFSLFGAGLSSYRQFGSL